MKQTIQDLFASKKFLFTFTLTVLCLLAARFGLAPSDYVKQVLYVVWPVYIASQGLADIGDKIGNANYNISAEQREHAGGIWGEFAKMLPAILQHAQGGLANPVDHEIAKKAVNLLASFSTEELKKLGDTLSVDQLKKFTELLKFINDEQDKAKATPVPEAPKE